MDWFALGGILIERGDVHHANDLHAKFMADWSLTGPLHSTDIRGSRRLFRFLGRDDNVRIRFFDELNDLLAKLPVIGIACVVDRPGYNSRYAAQYGDDRWLMCKTAFAIVIERAAKLCEQRNAKLEIFYEQCGEKEDRDLIEYSRDLKRNGMPFDQGRSKGYSALSREMFSSILLGEPKRLTKAARMIQVADIFLYPMVKAGYDPEYPPYRLLMEAGRIVDASLSPDERLTRGCKYSCFDIRNMKGPA